MRLEERRDNEKEQMESYDKECDISGIGSEPCIGSIGAGISSDCGSNHTKMENSIQFYLEELEEGREVES